MPFACKQRTPPLLLVLDEQKNRMGSESIWSNAIFANCFFTAHTTVNEFGHGYFSVPANGYVSERREPAAPCERGKQGKEVIVNRLPRGIGPYYSWLSKPGFTATVT